MFYFNKTVKTFKKDCDSFRTPYDGKNVIEPLYSVKAKKKARPLRIAACTVVAVALVLTGAVWIPKAQQSSDAHSFEIVAYAASGKSKAVTLKKSVAITLSKIDYYGMSSYPWQKISFECKGKDLDCSIYSAKSGYMLYQSKMFNKYSHDQLNTAERNNYLYKAASASLKKATIISFAMPKAAIRNIKKYYDGGCDRDVTGFAKLWNEGKFDKYYRNLPKNLNFASRYFFMITPSWNPINPQEKVGNDKYVVTIADSQNKNFTFIGFPSVFFAKSILVYPNDKKADLRWYPDVRYFIFNKYKSIEEKIYQIYCAAKSAKSDKTIDMVLVKATFKDGYTMTKHIKIYFNKSGNCCMKLTD